jgi:hypothetical protein
MYGFDIENSSLGFLLGSTVDMGDPITANVPEVPAKRHGLAMIADNLHVGDAILPHIKKQFRSCLVYVIFLKQ